MPAVDELGVFCWYLELIFSKGGYFNIAMEYS